VPANRIGFTQFSLAQLKIIQEAITLVVFVPFALFYMNQPLKLDYLWASLCIMARCISSSGADPQRRAPMKLPALLLCLFLLPVPLGGPTTAPVALPPWFTETLLDFGKTWPAARERKRS